MRRNWTDMSWANDAERTIAALFSCSSKKKNEQSEREASTFCLLYEQEYVKKKRDLHQQHSVGGNDENVHDLQDSTARLSELSDKEQHQWWSSSGARVPLRGTRASEERHYWCDQGYPTITQLVFWSDHGECRDWWRRCSDRVERGGRQEEVRFGRVTDKRRSEWMGFNSHLKKISVVHSDRTKSSYLNSYVWTVRPYKVPDSCVTTLSPHNVVMLHGHRYLEPPILGVQRRLTTNASWGGS